MYSLQNMKLPSIFNHSFFNGCYNLSLQIRRIVPIVQNIFQKHKSILEGFICSLIAQEIIPEFKWAGRVENSISFKEMKNIQVVLLSAMIRIDPSYTLYQFETDMKSVLKKAQTKKSQAQKNEENNPAEKNVGVSKDYNPTNSDD